MLEEGIQTNNEIISRMLGNYKIYRKYDKKNVRINRFVETNKPVELIRIDIFEVANKQKILLAIDYFTRKIFGRIVTSKRPSEIIKLLEKMKIREALKFDKVIIDSGRDFRNDKIQ